MAWAWAHVGPERFLIVNPKPKEEWTALSLQTFLGKTLPVIVRASDITRTPAGFVYTSRDELDLSREPGFLRVLHSGGKWVADPLPAKGQVRVKVEPETAVQIKVGQDAPVWMMLAIPAACAPGRSLCYRLAVSVLGSEQAADLVRKSKVFRGAFSLSPGPQGKLVLTPEQLTSGTSGPETVLDKIVRVLRLHLFTRSNACPNFLQDLAGRVSIERLPWHTVVVLDSQLVVDADTGAALLEKTQEALGAHDWPVLRFAHGFEEHVRDCIDWLDVVALALRHVRDLPPDTVLKELGKLSAEELNDKLGVLTYRETPAA
jgi:hypothetical protein